MRPLIYDVGMSAGEDVDYYLKKGYRVIGIEANPALCGLVAMRLHEAIADGSLMILNIAVGSIPGPAKFMSAKENSQLSTFRPEPRIVGKMAHDESAWTEIEVQVRRLSDVIAVFGPADYVKIDIEGFEPAALYDLETHGIRPRYLSAEATEIATPCRLIAMGYRKFKLGQGYLARRFDDLPITTVEGDIVEHTFVERSSGPFGEDIPGRWLNEYEMLVEWVAYTQNSWCDVHAWDGG